MVTYYHDFAMTSCQSSAAGCRAEMPQTCSPAANLGLRRFRTSFQVRTVGYSHIQKVLFGPVVAPGAVSFKTPGRYF